MSSQPGGENSGIHEFLVRIITHFYSTSKTWSLEPGQRWMALPAGEVSVQVSVFCFSSLTPDT
jgi:hypothetical protein